jgi:hypothetical protein
LRVISNFNTKNLIKEAEEDEKTYEIDEINNKKEEKLNSYSKKGIIYNQTDLYESEKAFVVDEEDYYKYYAKEFANEHNDSNKIELKNSSEIQKEKMKEIFQIRKLLKDLPLFNNIDFELDKFFEVVISTQIFIQLFIF